MASLRKVKHIKLNLSKRRAIGGHWSDPSNAANYLDSRYIAIFMTKKFITGKLSPSQFMSGMGCDNVTSMSSCQSTIWHRQQHLANVDQRSTPAIHYHHLQNLVHTQTNLQMKLMMAPTFNVNSETELSPPDSESPVKRSLNSRENANPMNQPNGWEKPSHWSSLYLHSLLEWVWHC